MTSSSSSSSLPPLPSLPFFLSSLSLFPPHNLPLSIPNPPLPPLSPPSLPSPPSSSFPASPRPLPRRDAEASARGSRACPCGCPS
eukprot:766395-Hanusia_phi.AAC.2